MSQYKPLHCLGQRCLWINCGCLFVVVVVASHYSALCIPNSAGAVRDLARNVELRTIINGFLAEKSKTCCPGGVPHRLPQQWNHMTLVESWISINQSIKICIAPLQDRY